MTESAPVRFDTKVAILVGDDLLPWQKLNVTAFLVSGIATSEPDLVGEPYEDADGATYLPMLRQPILVYGADAAVMSAARSKSVERGLAVAVYTRELFSTSHDAANRAAVRAVASNSLDLVGIGIRGPRNVVDRLIKGARMHA